MSVDESDDDAGVRRIAATGAERLRAARPGRATCCASACHDAGIAIDPTPVTHHGRVELPCWLREQAISWTRHRHGRVPPSYYVRYWKDSPIEDAINYVVAKPAPIGGTSAGMAILGEFSYPSMGHESLRPRWRSPIHTTPRSR